MDEHGSLEDQRTPYDNSVTMLYKWATYHGLEAIQVIPQPKNPQNRLTSNPDDYTYMTLLEFLTEKISEGLNLEEVLIAARRYNKYIDDLAILMTYLNYLTYQTDRDILFNMNQGYRLLQRAKRTIREAEVADDPNDRDRYDSLESIRPDKQIWEGQLRRWQGITEQRTETINLIQDLLAELEEEPELEFTPFEVTSKIFLFHPTHDQQPLTPEDGLDLFNHSVPSQYAPFIRYIDEGGKVYTKIYTGTSIDDQPRYANIIAEGREQARSVLLITLWLADVNSPYSEELKYAPKEEFFSVVYYLEPNHLTIEVPVNADEKRGLIADPQEAFNRLAAALSFVDLGRSEEIQVKGAFDILDFELDETLFLDTVLIEPVINSYLYLEESVKPFSLKKRIDLYYHPMMVDDLYINAASVSMILSQRGNREEIGGSQRRYIHVSITQAESETELNTFFHIFNLLLRLYLREIPTTRAAYDRLPELTNLAQVSRKEEKPDLNNNSRRRAKKSILELVDKAPEIFTRNYSRSCQSYRQPIILEPEEVEGWTKTFITVKNRLEERRVIRFPKEGTSFIFGCPNDQIPYPDLTKNNDTKTLVPCCFASRNEEGKSLYEEYMAGRPIDFTPGAQGNNLIITNKILLPGRIGVLPITVENILRPGMNVGSKGRLVRYGVSYAPDSLIHCILVALSDQDYLQADEEGRQQLVVALRQSIARELEPQVLMQELYDYTLDEIVEYLEDESSYLDPSLYYRALEEYFNLNIYVFRSSEDAVSGEIDLPRYKTFHARPYRDRPTILILKNYGSESDSLTIPQCELILDSDRNFSRVFGAEMNSLCYSILTRALQTVTGEFTDLQISLYPNLYYQRDYSVLPSTEVPAQTQIIDEEGKLRAVTYMFSDREYLTLYTLPSQPLSVPIAEELPHSSLARVRELFPEFSAYAQEGDQVIGVWLSVGEMKLAEYIPILPEQLKISREAIAPPPSLFAMTSIDLTSRLRKVKRDARILTQLLRWLYQIALSRRNTVPENWIERYIVVKDPPSADSSQYYDFSRLTRKLPQKDWGSSQQAITILGKIVPGLVENGKIVIYGEELFRKIQAMLMDYDRLTYDAFDRPPLVLDDYYQGIDDFIVYPQSKLFVGEQEFRAWLDRNKSPESNYPLVRAILSEVHPVTPYVYRQGDRLVLVQHSESGEIAQALALAYVWYYYRVNMGYYVRALNHVPAHIIYGLTPDGQLQELQRSGMGDNYLEVVYHGPTLDQVPPRRYAAILPL